MSQVTFMDDIDNEEEDDQDLRPTASHFNADHLLACSTGSVRCSGRPLCPPAGGGMLWGVWRKGKGKAEEVYVASSDQGTTSTSLCRGDQVGGLVSTGWTNDTHNMYISSMEASFMQQLCGQ
ncbi:hypothetical protein TRIUR3_20272 [Triticum urartu]|uniref:Uncharacterized protein n=1 Tax=Triticum urartu TaxID=4572 RepID=M7ZFL6_TRIUA|nr:hypothetical protein TRIUR3_20272 [Triticum urartu]